LLQGFDTRLSLAENATKGSAADDVIRLWGPLCALLGDDVEEIRDGAASLVWRLIGRDNSGGMGNGGLGLVWVMWATLETVRNAEDLSDCI
jgi:hypothetical protein